MPIPTSERPFDKLATELASDRFEALPTLASDLGLVEYDHLLPDMSADAIRAGDRRDQLAGVASRRGHDPRPGDGRRSPHHPRATGGH